MPASPVASAPSQNAASSSSVVSATGASVPSARLKPGRGVHVPPTARGVGAQAHGKPERIVEAAREASGRDGQGHRVVGGRRSAGRAGRRGPTSPRAAVTADAAADEHGEIVEQLEPAAVRRRLDAQAQRRGRRHPLEIVAAQLARARCRPATASKAASTLPPCAVSGNPANAASSVSTRSPPLPSSARRRAVRRSSCDTHLSARHSSAEPLRTGNGHELLLLPESQRVHSPAALHPGAGRHRSGDRRASWASTARWASSASRSSGPGSTWWGAGPSCWPGRD